MEAPQDWFDFLNTFPYPLRNLSIVSELTVEAAPQEGPAYESEEIQGMKIRVEKAQGEKCGRCWVHCRTVGDNPDLPEICSRCEEELKNITTTEEQGSPK